MPYLVVAPIVAFLLLSGGVRRVGPRLLGASFVAIAGSAIMAFLALLELERNLGPVVKFYVAFAGAALVSCGVAVTHQVRTGFLERLGHELTRSAWRVRLARAQLALFTIAVGLAGAATLRTCWSPEAAPDLAPLLKEDGGGLRVGIAFAQVLGLLAMALGSASLVVAACARLLL